MMYDVVIIGAGPAGISAGIYAASRGKKVLITEKNTVGGLIGKVSTVTHYAGIMTEETGSSFAKRLKIQAENTGIDIIYEEVTQVELQGSIKKVFTKDGAYDAKKIVLANGTTNIAGVYAVGDIRVKQVRQVSTAVADGTVAGIHLAK